MAYSSIAQMIGIRDASGNPIPLREPEAPTISVARLDGHWAVLWNGKACKTLNTECEANGYAMAMMEGRLRRC